ncbi:CASP-like protein 4B1 [Silene latifolia]|uniref:CASP-like protein 4B1 n=1 Tax=Silene latifolia TaxID=37657 RepID=UPI003D7779C5
MSNPAPESEKKALPQPPPETDVEGGEPVAVTVRSSGFGVGSVLRRWKRDDYLRKGSLGLRALGLFFSLLSFIIMASNNHGDWREFGKYEEYRYVLAIAILSTIYTGVQTYKQVHQHSTGKELLAFKNSALIDFVGDQITAYLLLSSASSAIPLTNRMRESSDNIFTDSSAASISMSLLAFLSLASSSVIAGYKLSTQSSL